MRVCLLLVLLIIFGCKDTVPKTASSKPKNNSVGNFQNILDAAHVTGAILIYDLAEDTYYSNDFKYANTGFLPASTFKIPNSIIALETGVVENESTLFTWDGKPRGMAIWEKNLRFKDAFQLSCVPCYQEIAKDIGVERMTTYLEKFKYGKMKFDAESLDQFWLSGASKISQVQQIQFLVQLEQSRLPISPRTTRIVKNMMTLKQTHQSVLRGKTGWVSSETTNIGWFVGYLEKENKRYFFATNIIPTAKCKTKDFLQHRKEVTFSALEMLGFEGFN